jgi:hypothetical protein
VSFPGREQATGYITEAILNGLSLYLRERDIPVFIIKNNLRLLNISTEEYLEILDTF